MPDLHVGQVQGVVADLDGLAAEEGGDAVAVVFEGKGGGFGHLARVTVEEGLAQLLGVHRPDGGPRVLAHAFEGRLAGFRMEFAVVDDLQPGQEGLVEQGQGIDRRCSQFRKKVRLDELEETLDFPSPFGIVGRTQDTLDAQGSADGVQVLGGVDLAPVGVDGQGAAVAQHGPFEAILQAGKLFVPVELGVGHQASVVVEESKEKDLAFFVGFGRIGQLGAMHGIALP